MVSSEWQDRLVPRAVAILLSGGLLVGSVTASAGLASGSLQVTARVVASCSISAGGLSFGDYDPLSSTDLDVNSSLTVSCTRGTPYTVALDQGSNQAPGSTPDAPLRQLSSGTETIGYNIYRDSARMQIWGGGTTVYSASATSKDPVAITIFGRLQAGLDATSGNYSDAVQATVNF